MTTAPRLLVVAHGTASVSGQADIQKLVAAVAARRELPVDLCFLDVVTPTLADALDERPTVVIPALLSTGYHVRSDIPAAVAAHPNTLVARHLGPHALLADALVDRLDPHADDTATFLVAAGSSRPEAADEVREQAGLLAARLGHPVRTATVTDDLPALFATARGPFQVACYLLAAGRFSETIAAAAGGAARVGPPLGAHPAVVELIWSRYDEAVEQVR